jgi:hypothetical protein
MRMKLDIILLPWIVALLITFAGCTSSQPTPTPPPILPTSTPAATATAVLKLRSPICGKQLDDPAQASRRPVAFKIDNAAAARPQSGLAEACIVYEHLAEGGVTRFTAFFHTEQTDPIGPIRSARRLDLSLVPQFQALFAHVGGSQAVMTQLRSSGLLDLDQFWNADTYYRMRERYAPHNVYTSMSRIMEAAQARGWEGPVSIPSYDFLSSNSPVADPAVTRIIIPISDYQVVEYRYDEAENDYLRFQSGLPHIDASTDEQIRVKNIVVQYVEMWAVSVIEDINGAPSLDFELLGEGEAILFRDGQSIPLRWVRPSLEVPTSYLDSSGRAVAFRPGNIWVELISPDTVVTADD